MPMPEQLARSASRPSVSPADKRALGENLSNGLEGVKGKNLEVLTGLSTESLRYATTILTSA